MDNSQEKIGFFKRMKIAVFKLEEKDIEINVPADTEIEIIGGLE